jgi:hypothetical protein
MLLCTVVVAMHCEYADVTAVWSGIIFRVSSAILLSRAVHCQLALGSVA